MADASPATLPGIKGLLALPSIAIFGVFDQLTLKFAPGVVGKITRVLGQDLRAATDVAATDITLQIKMLPSSDTIVLSGDLIASVGTAAKTAGDLSDPGLVLAILV